MNYMAAVFSNGHVATGRHHGEAFSNLSESDQNADLISGHVNADGTFTTELEHPNKDIILIRHAESMWNAEMSNDLDSSLTLKGISQAQILARFLRKKLDCRGYVGFTSPFDRCLQTSMPLRRQTNMRFFVRPEISELTNNFPPEGVQVPSRSTRYLNIEWNNYFSTNFLPEPPKSFLARLRSFLDLLPDRALVITHGSVIQILIELALGVKVSQIPEWDNSIGNASITYIKDGTVVWLAKNVA
jgi:broad specificity phosphatase PhoE